MPILRGGYHSGVYDGASDEDGWDVARNRLEPDEG